MQKQEQQALIEKVLAFEAEKTTDMRDSISSVPVSVYTDPAQYAMEEEALFKTLPVCFGHISQLPNNGDYISREICGVPLIVLRDQAGVLRAFINVCKHRGGRFVHEEKGEGLRALICSYHAWTYTTEGDLRGIPNAHGFDGLPDSCKRLSELPLADWNGFILIRLTPLREDEDQADFARVVKEFVGEQLDSDFAALNLKEHVVYDPKPFHRPINWKLAVDTFLENYHVRKTHRNTIDCMFLDTIGCYQRFGLQQRNLYPKKTIVSLRDVDKSEWNLRDHGNLLYLLFPHTLILIEPDHINVSIVYPDGLGDSYLHNFTLLPEAPDAKAREYFDRNNAILYEALEEDFSVATDVQSGLRSGACDHLVHGRYEQGLSYFHGSVKSLTTI
jgi:nitrite reductase/ring-hydroxylating ferredoxin subunit